MDVTAVNANSDPMAQVLMAAMAAQQQLITRQLTAAVEAQTQSARSIQENLGRSVDIVI